MNEAWKNYIQPILDAWQWDHFSWVWDPFFERYPKFNDEQRRQVEDALAITTFDTQDEQLAIKALSIAETLYTDHLATQRLAELIRNGLREQVQSLKLGSDLTYDYIVASSFFGVTEAIPFIKAIVEQIEKVKTTDNLNKVNSGTHNFEKWLEACSAALVRLEPYHPSKERRAAEEAHKSHHGNSTEK